jgi:hypothetical protein
VLVVDSAAELDVDVARNRQLCPTSPEIGVRLIEGLKRPIVQYTYRIMFHDHFVRLIIFVGIHVARAMTGGPTASYGKHGKLQNPFPPHRQTKPVITCHNNGIASFVAEKSFNPKNSDFALRFAPRVSSRNWLRSSNVYNAAIDEANGPNRMIISILAARPRPWLMPVSLGTFHDQNRTALYVF